MPKSPQTKRRNVRCGVRSPHAPNKNDGEPTNPPPPRTSMLQPLRPSMPHIPDTPSRWDASSDATTTVPSQSSLWDLIRQPPLGRNSSTKRHIPRPENSFMLFRKDYAAKHKSCKDQSKDMSRNAGMAWRHLPQDEKEYWVTRAAEAKDEHARRYPDYRFQPQHKPRTPKVQNERMSLRRDDDYVPSRRHMADSSTQDERTTALQAKESRAGAASNKFQVSRLPSFAEGFFDVDSTPTRPSMDLSTSLWPANSYQSSVFEPWQIQGDYNFFDAPWDFGDQNVYFYGF